MPDPTPGQICYEHYWPGLAQHSPSLVSDPPVAWDALPPGVQAAWDAAAKAVWAGKVVIDRDVFEHLLNCLANQKFLHEMAEADRYALQCVIDAAWVQGMDVLHGQPRIADSYQEDEHA